MSKIKKKYLILFFFCLLLLSVLICKNQTGFAENLDKLSVNLKIDGITYHYAYPDITYKSGLEEILIKNGRYDAKGRLKSIEGNFSAEYEFKNLKSYLEKIAQIIDAEPIPAKVTFDPDNVKFKTVPEILGKKLNVDKIVKTVNDSLKRGKSYSAVIKSDTVEPEFTEKSLKRSFNLRGSFTTDISESTSERKHNIALSLKAFNGLVIPPKTEISFNEKVGMRTFERGYQTAKVILDGEFTDGIGGGVCQTSTTLYNALLLSDIEITSHKKHSLLVSYVPASFDAMVSSSSDLKFKNNSKNYIYIKTACTNEKAIVQVYGEKLDYEIIPKSEIIFKGETLPEKKVIDSEGKHLNRVKYKDESFVLFYSKPKIISYGYLQYVKNGKVYKNKILRKDTYKEMVGTVVYGNLDRPQPKKEPKQDEPLSPPNLNGYLG